MTEQARVQLLEYVRRQLIGPVDGPEERIDDPPQKRYATGVLFPVESDSEDELAEDVLEDNSGADSQEGLDDPISLAGQWMPSSIGLSCYVEGTTSVECRVWGARYSREKGENGGWRRTPIAASAAPEVAILEFADGETPPPLAVLEGRAWLQIMPRPMGSGWLITVSLVNSQRSMKGSSITDRCLAQTGFEVRVRDQGRIADYPRVELLTTDAEEEELLLLHRNARVYGIGHGCAVDWENGPAVRRVWTEAIPAVDVAPVVASGDLEAQALGIARLADEALPFQYVERDLRGFAAGYRAWISSQLALARDVPDHLGPARDRLLSRLESQAGRIDAAIDFLAADTMVQQAFRLANLAMLMQIHHSSTLAAPSSVDDGPMDADIDYLSLKQYRWRPFQLAYLLLVLPGLADEAREDRSIVDLIWFPTGGGKTEAYLLVAAFQVMLRRLRDPSNGGTAVITRYTLRLLTTQQFQRATTLICAMETIRWRDLESLGAEPFRIGLWVGVATSPNTYVAAKEQLEDIRNGVSQGNFLQLERCSWCGTRLLPDDPSADPERIGCEATSNSFRIFCPSSQCLFHDGLPASVVDEDLYDHPPTILIGTVDKFAQLAWSDRGGAFFGLGGHRAPSLVIQDELHLVSGPLGTTVGIYEAAIDGLLALAGATPKVIASTATIRRAGEQVEGVFGRSVALFPPSGISAADSYFAREDRTIPGRTYVGLMSGNHTPSTALIQLSAALTQGPLELGLTGQDLDAYWTQVIYHNSIRELGNTLMYARDDIPARVKVIARDEARMRDLDDASIEELTSNIAGDQVTDILDRLSRDCSDAGSISLLVATNMIQVGIDVPRLGLMVVNGQPKTTSEYIQASSRIGRATALGLVVTLYSSTKPRDRSHYEGFRPYHDALYRHVEPTSVTPFSLPSRERALHAALVILVRHGAGLSQNTGARDFHKDDPRVVGAIDFLYSRARRIDPREADATQAHLHRLVSEWDKKARSAERTGEPLRYSATKQHNRLLKRYFTTGPGWETLDSMRSVDREATLFVLGGNRSA